MALLRQAGRNEARLGLKVMATHIGAPEKLDRTATRFHELPSGSGSVLSFSAGPHGFAAPGGSVLAIIEPAPVHGLPFSGSGVLGVMDYRGRVARVISLRQKLGLEELADPESGLFILAQLPDGLTAFWVDHVHDFLAVDNLIASRLPALGAFTTFSNCYLSEKGILWAVDFETLFALVPPKKRMSAPTATPLPEEAQRPDLMAAGKRLNPADKVREFQKEEVRIEPAKVPDALAAVPLKVQPEPLMGSRRAARPKIAQPTTPRPSMDFRPAAYPKLVSRAQEMDGPPPSQGAEPSGSRGRLTAAAAGIVILVAVAIGLWLRNTPGTEYPGSSSLSAPLRMEESARSKTRKAEVPRPAGGIQSHTPDQARVSRPAGRDRIQEAGATRDMAHSEVIPPLTGASGDKPADTPEASNLREKETGTPPRKKPGAEIRLTKGNDPAADRPGATSGLEKIVDIQTEAFMLIVERPARPAEKWLVQYQSTPHEITHIVIRGDTLWHIAERYLGNPWRYPELAKLSHIKDPDWIYPGDIIRIFKKHASMESR